jgi:two-component SAPR family response regulator
MNGLKIQTLGHAKVLRDGQPVLWRAELARTLVFYLLTHPSGKTRDEIIDALWNLEPDPIITNRFRVLVHRARAALGGRDTILEDYHHFRLATRVLEASDTHAFYTALERTKGLLTSEVRLESLQQLLMQYQGEYMPLETATWAQQAREQHRTSYVHAEIELSVLYCDKGAYTSSVAALARALHVDPFIGENYHQKLMIGLSIIQGKYAAIEHYRRFVAFLLHELEDVPMVETTLLATRIKNGECLSYHQTDGFEHHQASFHDKLDQPPMALGISGIDRNRSSWRFIPEQIFANSPSLSANF